MEVTLVVIPPRNAHKSMRHLPVPPGTLKRAKTRHAGCIAEILLGTHIAVLVKTGCLVLLKRGTCTVADLAITQASEFASVHKVGFEPFEK